MSLSAWQHINDDADITGFIACFCLRAHTQPYTEWTRPPLVCQFINGLFATEPACLLVVTCTSPQVRPQARCCLCTVCHNEPLACNRHQHHQTHRKSTDTAHVASSRPSSRPASVAPPPVKCSRCTDRMSRPLPQPSAKPLQRSPGHTPGRIEGQCHSSTSHMASRPL